MEEVNYRLDKNCVVKSFAFIFRFSGAITPVIEGDIKEWYKPANENTSSSFNKDFFDWLVLKKFLVINNTPQIFTVRKTTKKNWSVLIREFWADVAEDRRRAKNEE